MHYHKSIVTNHTACVFTRAFLQIPVAPSETVCINRVVETADPVEIFDLNIKRVSDRSFKPADVKNLQVRLIQQKIKQNGPPSPPLN